MAEAVVGAGAGFVPNDVSAGASLVMAGTGTAKGNAASDAYSYYLQKAQTLDVTTAPNQAVFYSGRGNRALAEAFATANGKTTLEMTPGGSWLDSQKLFEAGSGVSSDQAYTIWSTFSQRYAEGASGNAVGFVEGSDPASIFNTVEYPAFVIIPISPT